MSSFQELGVFHSQ